MNNNNIGKENLNTQDSINPFLMKGYLCCSNPDNYKGMTLSEYQWAIGLKIQEKLQEYFLQLPAEQAKIVEDYLRSVDSSLVEENQIQFENGRRK